MASVSCDPNSMVLINMLSRNEKWVDRINATNPGFFPTSAERQCPKVLWIGCADSRVPESVITDSYPGDIFVQRNIANQLLVTDDNAISVLNYAVMEVKVEHVIVVGHTNCGGVKAAWDAAQEPTSEPTSPLERWLVPLTELARNTDGDLSAFTEVNVREQVANVLKSEAIEHEWKHRDVQIHGWMYELETGKLRDLGISVGRNGPQQF